jgi:hypothetical protein
VPVFVETDLAVELGPRIETSEFLIRDRDPIFA